MRTIFTIVILFYCRIAQPAPLFQSALQKLHAGRLILPLPSHFTNALDDNLIKVYSQEISAESRKFPLPSDKAKRLKALGEYAQSKNASVEERLSESPLSGTPDIIAIAQKVFAELSTNSVTKIAANDKYDTRGDVGFCFARATLVHYLLLKNSIPQDHIAKIFALGKMRHHQQLWTFHVATMVKGPGREWLVIDNLFDKVLTSAEWMKNVLVFDTNPESPQIRYYVTDARKFQPGYGPYREEDFSIADLKKYYSDMFRSIE